MIRFRAIGLAVATTALSLMASSVAHGATSLNADPANDVWENGNEIADPDVFVNVDLHVTDVRHRKWAVLVEATYYELKRTDEHFYFMLSLLAQAGPDGNALGYSSFVDVKPGKRGGSHSLSGAQGIVDCKKMSHEVDYAADTIALRIPRACINTPKWVQFAAYSGKEGPATDDAAPVSFTDDARSENAPFDGYSERIYRGPVDPY